MKGLHLNNSFLLFYIVGDGLMILTGYGLAKHLSNIQDFGELPWLVGISILVFYFFDLYTNWRRKSLASLLHSIILANALAAVLVSVSIWGWTGSFQILPLKTVLFQTVLMVVLRSLVWGMEQRYFGGKSVLIVCESMEDGWDIAEKLRQHTSGWFLVHEVLVWDPKVEWEEKVRQVDTVMLSPFIRDKEEILSSCTQWSKEALIIPKTYELCLIGSESQQIDDLLVLSIRPPGLSFAQRLLKRAFDLIGSSAILVLLSPVMLLLLFLIPLTSKGPALYRQERIGMNGKPYYLYKFRSMVQDAEKDTGPVLATERDFRITTIGRWIRKTRIDELPQVINVLKGNMSLVGPRPERAYFINKFKKDIPEYAARMDVKPGITGLAQVKGNYKSSAEDKLRYDIFYIRNYSILLDLQILSQTIRVVMQPVQAAGVKREGEMGKFYEGKPKREENGLDRTVSPQPEATFKGRKNFTSNNEEVAK